MPRITFKPLTSECWSDFEMLFGDNGACGGCWCMAWRLMTRQFQQGKGAANKRAIRRIVSSNTVPGILAYSGREPVGWISFGPRESFVRLEKSKVLAPVDDQPVWSVSCFFVRKDFRNQGLTSELLNAASKFAKHKRAKILEGYPYDINQKLSPPFVWTGLLRAFEKAGFEEVARRSKTRPIMRRSL